MRASPPTARFASWFVYVLECEDGSLYTGIAIDPHARFAAHASGRGARYTRSRRPVRLLATLAFPDRSSALKAEYRIKQMSARDKRTFALEHGESPGTPAV